MRALDVFVLPSLREGLSNTILEAMASGLPVVATRVGGNPELVEEGHTGQLVPPADPVAMAAAIVSIAATVVWRCAMGGRVVSGWKATLVWQRWSTATWRCTMLFYRAHAPPQGWR